MTADALSAARTRRFVGIVGLVSATALAFAAVAYQAPWWARLIVFVPLWFAGVGLLGPQRQRRALIIAAALTFVLALLP